jgi:hypothetical protein
VARTADETFAVQIFAKFNSSDFNNLASEDGLAIGMKVSIEAGQRLWKSGAGLVAIDLPDTAEADT